MGSDAAARPVICKDFRRYTERPQRALHAGGRGGCLPLAIHTFLPHEPNLRIRDH